MKLLFVNSSIDPFSGGGTAERTVQLAIHLSRKGIETSILTSDQGVDEKLYNRISGIKLHTLPLIAERYLIPKVWVPHIIKIIKEIDIVHLMNHWTAFNAVVYILCKWFRKPYVICPAGALPIFGRSRKLKSIYNIVIGNSIIQNAAAHVGITENETRQFLTYGVEPKKVTIIPNGINPEDFIDSNKDEFRKKFGIGNHPFILFVGRLNLIKGPDLLLEAFAGILPRFPDYHLVFAGPDEGMLESLHNFVESRKIQHSVHFIGYITGKEKSWAYHAAELLAVTSRQEAMSIVALEAGCTGTPVLLTDVCGFDQVEAIGGGLVVRPTVTDIKDGLDHLLHDPLRMERMGSALEKFVLDNFTWNSVVDRYVSLFQIILNGKPGL